MTNPMRLVPVKPTLDMEIAFKELCEEQTPPSRAYSVAMKHAPNSGKVSREQLDKATRVLVEGPKGFMDGRWDAMNDSWREEYREMARAMFMSIGLQIEGEN